LFINPPKGRIHLSPVACRLSPVACRLVRQRRQLVERAQPDGLEKLDSGAIDGRAAGCIGTPALLD